VKPPAGVEPTRQEILRWESVSQHPLADACCPRFARILKPGTYGSP
jgi:hypothetical protein